MAVRLLAAVAAILVALFAQLPAAAAERLVTDLLGRQLLVPEDPRRIVALAPSLSEIVFALGAEARLAGVVQFADFPPAARALPVVGSYVRPDLERIVGLAPDLVLAIRDGNPKEVVERLGGLGIPVFAMDPRDLAGVLATIAAVGSLVGEEQRAAALVADLHRRLAAVEIRIPAAANRPRVLFQIGEAPLIAAGPETFLDEAIRRAGGVNALAAGIYPKLDMERVLALAPEVIVVTSMTGDKSAAQLLAPWRDWPGVPAVAADRLYVVEASLFDRPSPRLVDGIEVLSRLLHPQAWGAEP
ncbi:MAG: cobalamin-binding protein [Thermodesulfobacteriota bacterium]